jgi:uncharacterized protein YgbK (DUF1537 family)
MDLITEGAARAQISNLQATYHNCGDRGRIEELVTIFTEDARYDLPDQTLNGKQAIFDYLSSILKRSQAAAAAPGKQTDVAASLAGSRHHITTRRIEFTSDTEADGWTYFFVMRRGAVFQEGTYIDHYRLTGEGWRIAARRLKVIWNEPSAAT